ncbi:helix-loop-helix DNA-binding domain-containing protein [Limtongia smithiae]|uniref:helix-loop-helix DNA-binding domain-containing protein n=1 Tax=Limtongia smithiae TaxID=1125753 RepID=UPI0034CD82F0
MSYASPPSYIKADPDAALYYGSAGGGGGTYTTTTNSTSLTPQQMQQAAAAPGGGDLETRGFYYMDAANSKFSDADLIDSLDDTSFFDLRSPPPMPLPEQQPPLQQQQHQQTQPQTQQQQQQIQMQMQLQQQQQRASAPLDMDTYFSPTQQHASIAGAMATSTSPFDELIMQQQHQQHRQQQSAAATAATAAAAARHHGYYAPKMQSHLQSVSVPESDGGWTGTPPESGSYGMAAAATVFSSPPPPMPLPLSVSAATAAGSSSLAKSGSYHHDQPESKQQLLMMEKRRRRRESHNAVERRRRDNINEKIQELALLLPEHLFAGTGIVPRADGTIGVVPGVNSGSFGTESSTPAGTSVGTPSSMSNTAMLAAAGKDGKPNKGIILRKSVDYIRQLQVDHENTTRENSKLREQLRALQAQLGIVSIEDEDEDEKSAAEASAARQHAEAATTSSSGNAENDDFFEYEDTIFPASPTRVSDSERHNGLSSMDLS